MAFMKTITILLILLANINLFSGDTLPADTNYGTPMVDGSVSLLVFGKSYHTNREPNYRETNPGLGIAVNFEPKGDFANFMVVGGAYMDSYDQQARFLMAGPQLVLGYREAFHVIPGFCAGFLKGSGHNGSIIMPYLAIGYNRVDLCFTGDPSGSNNNIVRNQNGSIDRDHSSTAAIAIFLKVNIFKW